MKGKEADSEGADATLLASKMEERAVSPGMEVTAGSWKGKEVLDPSLKPLKIMLTASS